MLRRKQAERGCGGNELTGRRGVDCDALAVEVRAAVLPSNKALVGHDVECDTQHGLLFVAQPDGDGNLRVVGRGVGVLRYEYQPVFGCLSSAETNGAPQGNR